jgi:predicted aspartyl protease
MAHQLNFGLTHKYDSAKGGIVIPVSLILDEKIIECQAKVDTGAEHCLFARSYADQLGLDVESGHQMEMGTLTASFTAFGHVITLQTLNMAFESTVYFPQSYEIRRNLLGRNGWLHFVRLGIAAYDEIIYLSLYDDMT